MQRVTYSDPPIVDDDGRGYFSNKANAALALWTTPTVVGQKVV